MPEADPASGYTPRHQGHRPRRRGRLALAAAVLAVAIAAVAALGYTANLASMFTSKTNTIVAFGDGAAGEPDAAAVFDVDDGSRNILLLGSDSRAAGEEATRRDAADGADSDQRADTMMLVHIPKDRGNIYVMSLVRDMWVEIPGHGEDKINAALGLGGYPLVVDTVEALLETRIDNVVAVDFDGFSALTTALGGVTVINKSEFCTGHEVPSCFPKGKVTVEGNDALRFVRERKAFSDGDFRRVQNQQRFVAAVLKKFMTNDTLGNPITVQKIVSDFSPYLSVDETLDAGTVAGLALQLKDMDPKNVKMFTVPTGHSSTSAAGASIILRDDAALASLRGYLADDDLGGFLDSADQWTNAYGGAIRDGSSSPAPAPAEGAE